MSTSSKLLDIELTDFKTSSNRTIKYINIVSSITAVMSWILSYVFYFISNHQISNFHFYEYKSLPMKFEINFIVVLVLSFYFLISKMIFIMFLSIYEDAYIISILNERANYFYVLNDMLMSFALICPLVINNNVELSTIICICLCGIELICQAFCYTKFKNKRNINWKVQICYFIFSDMRIVFISFQIINGFCFYLFNLYKYTDFTLEVVYIFFLSVFFLVGILLITYFKDIFFMLIYILMTLGLILGDSTGGLSSHELIASIALLFFSILIVSYISIMYKDRIWGEIPFENILIEGQRKFGRSESLESTLRAY